MILGMSHVDLQICMAGSGIAQWIRSKSGCWGCHVTFFTDEWCISTATIFPAVKDQIQTVVGTKSSFVAIKVPSQFIAMMEILCVGLLVFVNVTNVGGLAGCGAAM